jgi:hypothetical protein
MTTRPKQQPDQDNHEDLSKILDTAHTTSTPAGCYAPASSAASSMNTDTQPDVQRRLFERHRIRRRPILGGLINEYERAA